MEAALGLSTTQSTLTQTVASDASTPASQVLGEGTAAFRTPSPGTPRLDSSGILSRPTKAHKWKCQVIISSPPPVDTPETTSKKSASKGDRNKIVAAPEPEYLVRANSLAGYWELNRRALRNMASRAITDVAPSVVPADDAAPPPISTSAQISPDTLIGEGSRVGDRASIKKCIVGRHCVIGRGAKITGSVLWDFVVIEEKSVIYPGCEKSVVDLTAPGSRTRYCVPTCVLVTNPLSKTANLALVSKPSREASHVVCNVMSVLTMTANLKGERMVAGQEA